MSDNGIRYFCPLTSKRLVGPGLSKDIDPIGGVEEFIEPPATPAKKPADKPAKKDQE